MALRLIQPGRDPIGQYDGLDTEVLSLNGGEVVTFTSVSITGSDKGAYDSFDGYVDTSSTEQRVVVTSTLASGDRPLMLADEGTSPYYGTLFGQVVGGTVGQTVTGGAVLGPHTATGSGKVTCWDKPGLYAVSLDACDTNASTGLQPTNTTIATGDKLYATTSGILTPNSSHADRFENVSVGRFISFETNGSLVNTPVKLAQALNSPSGATAPLKSFTWAVFMFTPPN